MAEYTYRGLKLSPQASLHPTDAGEHPCRLCGCPTTGRGIYSTFAPKVVIAPEGRTHFRLYAICGPCLEVGQVDPRRFDAIEAEDERMIAAVDNQP